MNPSKIDVQTRLDLIDLPQKAMEAVIWGNVEQYIDCFAEDAVWDPRPLGSERYEGRSAIRQGFLDAWAGLEWAAQGHYFTRIAEFSGTSATLRTYLGEWGRSKAGEAPVGFGMYTDDCVLENGVWRFKVHSITGIYFGPSDYSKPIYQQSPQRGPFK